jgi:hypothetical protein
MQWPNMLCSLVVPAAFQMLAIDSARQNVDVHFNYICKAQMEFNKAFSQQFAQVSVT